MTSYAFISHHIMSCRIMIHKYYPQTDTMNFELQKFLNPQKRQISILGLKAVNQSIWCLVDWEMKQPTYINISATNLQMSLQLKKAGAPSKRDLGCGFKKRLILMTRYTRHIVWAINGSKLVYLYIYNYIDASCTHTHIYIHIYIYIYISYTHT